MKILTISEEPTFLNWNGKKVLVSSFFNSNSDVGVEVARNQIAVFNHFNLLLNLYDSNMRHPEFMDYMVDTYRADIYLFFDVDCIPLAASLYSKAFESVGENCIFGASQQDNGNDLNHVYAAPCCLCFTQNTFNRVGRPSFVERQRIRFKSKIVNTHDIFLKYQIKVLLTRELRPLVSNIIEKKYFIQNNHVNFWNWFTQFKLRSLKQPIINANDFYENAYVFAKKTGGEPIGDVAEEFSYLCEEQNIKLNLLKPISSANNKWQMQHHACSYGNGTNFDNLVYHQFQIRFKDQQQQFIEKCKAIMSSK